MRSTLYMGALVASWRNPVLRDFYQRLLEAGKPKQVALAACARKLLTISTLWQGPAFTGIRPLSGLDIKDCDDTSWATPQWSIVPPPLTKQGFRYARLSWRC